MKRLMSLFVSIVALAGLVALPVSAHVLKTDGTIGAVLHIEPDDNPISGTVVSYKLLFTDTAGKFSLPICNCGISVQSNNTTIYTHSLDATNPLDTTGNYTFPSPGVYSLIVTGVPKTAGAFQAFTLTYSVRAEPSQNLSSLQPFPISLGIGLALLMGLLLLVAYKLDRQA